MLDSGFRSGGASPWHKQDKYLKIKNKVNNLFASQRKIQVRTLKKMTYNRIDTGIDHRLNLRQNQINKPAHPRLKESRICHLENCFTKKKPQSTSISKINP